MDSKVEFEKMFKSCDEKDPYPVEKAESRNIIFVGKTRCGKTTVLNVLRNPIYLSGSLSIFAETVEPNIFTISVKDGNENYILNIIDTPGLYEIQRHGEDMRDNEILKKMIQKCMQNEIKKINAIFFVCSFSEGIDKQQIDSFVEFCKLFEGAENRIALLITRAESLSPERKSELIKDLKQLEQMRNLIDKIGDNIFFSGSLTMEDYERGFTDSIKVKGEKVCEMRNQIFKFLFRSKEYVNLKDLAYMSHYEENTVKMVQSFFNLMKEFNTAVSENDYKKASRFKKQIEKVKVEIDKNTQFMATEKNKQLLTSFQNSKEDFENTCEDKWNFFTNIDISFFLEEKKSKNSNKLRKIIKMEIRIERLLSTLNEEDTKKIDEQLYQQFMNETKRKIN